MTGTEAILPDFDPRNYVGRYVRDFSRRARVTRGISTVWQVVPYQFYPIPTLFQIHLDKGVCSCGLHKCHAAL